VADPKIGKDGREKAGATRKKHYYFCDNRDEEKAWLVMKV